MIVVAGPAGIGKSHLVAEATRGVGHVVHGRCVADGGAPPLWPWLRILGRVSPDLQQGTAVPGAEGGWSTDVGESAAARFQLLIRWCDALVWAADTGPGLVVVIEDLHDADEASLALLDHVAAEAGGSRLLVICTLRDVGGESAVTTALAEMARNPAVHRIPLGPFTVADVGDYLRTAGVEPGLADRLHEYCGGLPVLVATMTRMLAAAEHQLAGWRVLPPLPAADSNVLMAGLFGGLGPAVHSTAVAAAVLGDDVDPRLLAEVQNLPVAAVMEHLDALTRAGILVEVAEVPGRYRFAHAMVREGLAQAAGDTAGWHRRSALALEARSGSEPEQAGRIAAHWARAGRDIEAMRSTVRWTRVAAAHAFRILAPTDAIRLLEQVLTVLDQIGPEPGERAQVLTDLARAEYLGGRVAASLIHLRGAAAEADAARRPDLLTGAALVINGAGDPEVLGAAAALCDRALIAIDNANGPSAFDDPHERQLARARLTARKACLNVEADVPGDLGPATAAALRLAENCGDPTALLDAARARAGNLTEAGDVQERRDLGGLTVHIARGAGYSIAAVRGHIWRIDAAYQLADLAAADDEIARLGELAASCGLPTARWFHLRVCAARSALAGRFDQARSESHAAGALAVRLNDPVACAVTDQFTGLLALARGDRSEVPTGIPAATRSFPRIPLFQAAQALQLELLGDQAQALVIYEHLRLLLSGPLKGIRGLGLLQYLTELVERFDDVEAAGWALPHWQPWVATGGVPGNAEYFCGGAPARAVGRMAAIAGDVDQAESALRIAAAVNTQLDAQPWLTHTWLALADVLGRRGGPTRLAEATKLAGRAAAQARRLDQPGPLTRADALLVHLTGLRQITDPLTSREHEIADMVAQALSNRQIAERLFVSERTVESHVHNILRKLDVTNRTQLTAQLLGSRE